MLNDPVLTREWFPVATSSSVPAATLVGTRMLGVDLVVWRSEAGIRAWQDLRIHRGARLSLGTVRNDCLVCPYHAWQYDPAGRCIQIPAQPAQPPPLKARANVFQAIEQYGLIWVSLADPQQPPPHFPELHDPSLLAGAAAPSSTSKKSWGIPRWR
jgi:phenylpropionate dioxygenase-like ring-hydroxylating dioxygenase large terminal subunit